MISLAGLQIIMRNGFQSGFVETDSVLRVLVLWLGMFGAVVAARERRHIAIDILSRYLSVRARQLFDIIINVFVVMVCALLVVFSMRMLLIDYAEGTIAFSGVHTWLLESILPIAFGIMSLRYLMYSWQSLTLFLKGRTGA